MDKIEQIERKSLFCRLVNCLVLVTCQCRTPFSKSSRRMVMSMFNKSPQLSTCQHAWHSMRWCKWSEWTYIGDDLESFGCWPNQNELDRYIELRLFTSLAGLNVIRSVWAKWTWKMQICQQTTVTRRLSVHNKPYLYVVYMWCRSRYTILMCVIHITTLVWYYIPRPMHIQRINVYYYLPDQIKSQNPNAPFP